ncbi:MAG TPA: ferrochelatase, partial [Rhodopila sp.]|nr:ferrochelatase [Rhodopila sp.]
KDKTAVLVVPIAFVSEHTETLVELDVEYRHLAERTGVPGYFRMPTQNADAGFIACLAGLARRALAHGPGLCSGEPVCGAAHRDCPFRVTALAEGG